MSLTKHTLAGLLEFEPDRPEILKIRNESATAEAFKEAIGAVWPYWEYSPTSQMAYAKMLFEKGDIEESSKHLEVAESLWRDAAALREISQQALECLVTSISICHAKIHLKRGHSRQSHALMENRMKQVAACGDLSSTDVTAEQLRINSFLSKQGKAEILEPSSFGLELA